MKLSFRYLVVLFFVALNGFAQKVTVKGLVKDEAGVYLIGATVSIKGTNWGVSTDFDGAYSIGAEVGQTLVFSYVGMKTEERKVTSSTKQIDVVLKEDVQTLDDVVVVGYGSGRKIGTTIGSVAKVSAKDFAETPSINAIDALQGKVAGVSINTAPGRLGRQKSIVLLHGIGTLQDAKTADGEYKSQPLYVLDGIPVSSDVMSDMNPDDFESVTVLKDASATSIYGARAANGVIYITTKKGKFEQKPQIKINTQVGYSTLINRDFFEDLLTPSEYMDFFVSTGVPRDIADGILEQYPHHTRWDKIYYKDNSLTSQTNLSVSGGGSNISYYLSAGNFQQKSPIPGMEYERYTLYMNLDSRLKDWLSLGTSLSLGYNESISNGQGNKNVLALPFYSPYDDKGNRLDYIPTPLSGGGFYHPLYEVEKKLNNSQITTVTPNFYVVIEPIENLKFRTQAGLRYNVITSEDKILPSHLEFLANGEVSRRHSEGVEQTITNTLEYKFGIGNKHFFTALLGQESLYNGSKGFLARSTGQSIDGLTNLNTGRRTSRVGDNKEVTTFNSYFSRFDYNYGGKYFFDASFRRDGSSSFGKDNRYANFWSVGAMWDIKKETFLDEVSWLNDLRLKVSTGISGSVGGGAYGSYTLIETGEYNSEQSLLIKQLGNPKLRWEKQHKTTLGINIGLFSSVNLGIDLYDREIRDMFSTATTPRLSGFSTYPTNLAKLQNRGVDITLSATVYRNKVHNINITPYINAGYNTQKVLELLDGRDRLLPTNPFEVGYEKGGSLMIFAPIFKGVNPDNGDPEWYLPSDNRMETTTDDSRVTNKYDVAALLQSTGKPAFAPWNGGFGLNANYKTLSLQVGFSFSYNKYQYNTDRVLTESPSFGSTNQSKKVLDYWQKPGDIARNPRTGVTFTQRDSRLLEDASFIRLKNINLGYALPKDVMKDIDFFEDIRFYVAARNLLTFTKFTGHNPEYNVTLSGGGYPSTREYVFGLELKF